MLGNLRQRIGGQEYTVAGLIGREFFDRLLAEGRAVGNQMFERRWVRFVRTRTAGAAIWAGRCTASCTTGACR